MIDRYDVADLALLTAGYWVVDAASRGDGWLRGLGRLGIKGRPWVIGLWALPWLVLAPFWSWSQVQHGALLRVLALVLAVALTWNAVTKDIDLGVGETNGVWRVLLIASTIGIYISPGFLLIVGFLFTYPFALWQHHATLPMRVVQVLMAHVCLASMLIQTRLGGMTALMFLVLTVVVSHYLITAAAKVLLGPRWYSWVKENRLHHLAANAYSWGWARFVPWPTWLKVINLTKRLEKPLQLSAFGIEALSPLALWHPSAAIAFCLAWAIFHAGVFLLSGLLFWDWMLTNVAVAYVVLRLPQSVTAELFGPLSVIAAIAFMVMFPLRHKLWKPMPLGWFDTPLTQRVYWRVRGESGKLYGLYNNFMCPHERLYGKVHGCFLVPVPVVTYHLGEVYKADLRDAIRQAGPDLTALEQVRRQFGILPRSEEMAAHHESYLRRFFQQFNKGARKRVLPRWLRWLKAPGGQIFYWGDLPAFTGQERVVAVDIGYREEYFDGAKLCRLRDEVVREVDIDARDALEPVREFTPKEIDDFLLRFAAGRLIDLPGFGGGYVQSDDGKRVA